MRNALIFFGGWGGHEPEACSSIFANLLKQHNFNVECHEGVDILLKTELTKFDLIIPMVTMGEISYEAISKLCDAVKSGVGLAGFHGGMGDSFRQSVEFQFMVGGQWVAHPGDFIDYKVNIVDKSHPIMQGIDDFDYHSEQYYMHVDPGNHVLATTTYSGEHLPWIDGVIMPVAWIKSFGNGKVFYCSLGHNANEFTNPEFKAIILNGALFVTRP